MDTLIKSGSVSRSAEAEKIKTTSVFTKFTEELEAARFGFAPMILVAVACLGGIAAAFAVQESHFQLMTVAVTSALVEVLVIALAPMRIIFAAAVIAIIVDLLVFLF